LSDLTENGPKVPNVQLVELSNLTQGNVYDVAMLAASAPVTADRQTEDVVQLAQSAPERETDSDWDFLSESDGESTAEREGRDAEAERLDASMTNFVVNGLSAVRYLG
jgi:hypothetical protein